MHLNLHIGTKMRMWHDVTFTLAQSNPNLIRKTLSGLFIKCDACQAPKFFGYQNLKILGFGCG
jgi:hypothetical protein